MSISFISSGYPYKLLAIIFIINDTLFGTSQPVLIRKRAELIITANQTILIFVLAYLYW
jgi:hypothetical protein